MAHELNLNRLEAFSDGVFAIAITLLILEVKIPSHEDIEVAGGLKNFLWQLWPSFFAYVFSFIVIGIYWANHHYFLSMFRKTDHVFNMLSVGFLMFVSFMPYPTALLGDFILDEKERMIAIPLYALGIWLPSFCWFFLWMYGKKNLIDNRISKTFINKLTKLYLLSNLFYCISFMISFINPFLSLGINVILAILYLMPPKKIQYENDSKLSSIAE